MLGQHYFVLSQILYEQVSLGFVEEKISQV